MLIEKIYKISAPQHASKQQDTKESLVTIYLSTVSYICDKTVVLSDTLTSLFPEL